MNFKNRATRIAAALSITALIASQIPMRGETALGSVQQPTDGYPSPEGDNSGSFLGIRGLTNRNAITGVGLGLLGLGAYSTILDSRAVGAAAAGASGAMRNGILGGVSNKPIYDVLMSMPDDFSEAVKLIDAAGLPDVLRDDVPYTFFAPTNAATGLIPSQFRQPENKEDTDQAHQAPYDSKSLHYQPAPRDEEWYGAKNAQWGKCHHHQQKR